HHSTDKRLNGKRRKPSKPPCIWLVLCVGAVQRISLCATIGVVPTLCSPSICLRLCRSPFLTKEQSQAHGASSNAERITVSDWWAHEFPDNCWWQKGTTRTRILRRSAAFGAMG